MSKLFFLSKIPFLADNKTIKKPIPAYLKQQKQATNYSLVFLLANH
jgi:hypothetical protein